jgi:cyclopropane-fatty-acyl-phospholipid synthase
MISNSATACSPGSVKGGLIDRLARRLLTGPLAGLRRGELVLQDASQESCFGQRGDLHALVRVHSPRFYRECLLGGTLSVAETYLRGDWDCNDLTSLFRIFVRNLDSADRLDGGLARIAGLGHKLFHWWNANTRAGSRRNIGAHYDLGNDFYRLWLDDTLAYSSGIFPAPHASLHEASIEKFDRVCRKLDLRPGDEVLEIGTGWGGFALHAASQYGCRVTTTTISREQFLAAEQRIRDARLQDRITLVQKDYRDLTGQFDKLVSIEMIEAVGREYFDVYFRKCSELLRPEGSLVLQAIVMPERGYDQYLKNVDFIRRYVFPGGCLPSLGAMLDSAGRTTDLRFVHAEDFAPHYAETLRRWRQAFHRRLEDVRALGYKPEFIRLWNYYLCYCEAVFEERHVGVVQIQFDKPLCRRDPLELSSRAAGAHRTVLPMKNPSPSRFSANHHGQSAP